MKKKNRRKVKKDEKRPQKQAWIQETAQWRKDILICTGFSAKEITRKIKQQKAYKWMIDFACDHEKTWQDLIDKGCAFVAREEEHAAFVLRLRAYEDTWNFWETLIHELNHLVDGMAEAQAFEKEWEAKAYLQEYLFHEIRRKLQGRA